MSEPESVVHLQEPSLVQKLADMAELAKQVHSEIDRAKREGPDALP